jgi:hypothetical protein
VFAGAVTGSMSGCLTEDTKRHEYTLGLLVWSVEGRSAAARATTRFPVTPRARIRSRLRALPSLALSTAIADAPSPVGDLGKVYGALAVTTIPMPRVHYLTRRIHLLGERPLAELFIELAAGSDLHGVLERYARLAPAADFIRALGGDRLTTPRAVSGGRR